MKALQRESIEHSSEVPGEIRGDHSAVVGRGHVPSELEVSGRLAEDLVGQAMPARCLP